MSVFLRFFLSRHNTRRHWWGREGCSRVPWSRPESFSVLGLKGAVISTFRSLLGESAVENSVWTSREHWMFGCLDHRPHVLMGLFRDGAWSLVVFRVPWVVLLSSRLRTFCLVVQPSEELTIATSCQPLQQKKNREIEGSCLRGKAWLFQGEQRCMKSRDVSRTVAESCWTEPCLQESRRMVGAVRDDVREAGLRSTHSDLLTSEDSRVLDLELCCGLKCINLKGSENCKHLSNWYLRVCCVFWVVVGWATKRYSTCSVSL